MSPQKIMVCAHYTPYCKRIERVTRTSKQACIIIIIIIINKLCHNIVNNRGGVIQVKALDTSLCRKKKNTTPVNV